MVIICIVLITMLQIKYGLNVKICFKTVVVFHKYTVMCIGIPGTQSHILMMGMGGGGPRDIYILINRNFLGLQNLL